MNRYFFGIDLGTTNSVISVYDAALDTLRTIKVGESALVKSAIYYPKDSDKLQVGKPTPESDLIKDVKSSIGDDNKKYKLRDKTFTPVDVSAFVLKTLKLAAQKEFPELKEIKDVTVTVPAKFNHKERSNTVKAANKAGLNVVSLINEPTAASLSYVGTMKRQEVVLVYDLGGGTFDASVANVVPKIKALNLPKLKIKTKPVERQIVSVVCSDGDVNLGGNDLDAEFVRVATEGINHDFTEKQYKSLISTAQEFKESGKEAVSWRSDDETVEVTFLEEHLVKATEKIYKRTYSIVQNMLRNRSSIVIDKIILVGGSTKNPYLQRMLKEDFPGVRIFSNINPDECVSLGAAKNTFISTGEATDMSFFDISSDTVGAKIWDGERLIFERMIEKGTSLPAKFTKKFKRHSESQTTITIPIFQGEYNDCNYNYQLGSVSIDNIPLSTPLDENLLCTFEMDKNGILTCTICIAGKTRSITINSRANDSQTNESVDKELESAIEDILTTNLFLTDSN